MNMYCTTSWAADAITRLDGTTTVIFCACTGGTIWWTLTDTVAQAGCTIKHTAWYIGGCNVWGCITSHHLAFKTAEELIHTKLWGLSECDMKLSRFQYVVLIKLVNQMLHFFGFKRQQLTESLLNIKCIFFYSCVIFYNMASYWYTHTHTHNLPHYWA